MRLFTAVEEACPPHISDELRQGTLCALELDCYVQGTGPPEDLKRSPILIFLHRSTAHTSAYYRIFGEPTETVMLKQPWG
jgi:hypothetical protein